MIITFKTNDQVCRNTDFILVFNVLTQFYSMIALPNATKVILVAQFCAKYECVE